MPLSHQKRPRKNIEKHCLYKSEPGGSNFLLQQTKKTRSAIGTTMVTLLWRPFLESKWRRQNRLDFTWFHHQNNWCLHHFLVYFVARNRRQPVGRPRLGPESDHKQQQSRQRNSPRCPQRWRTSCCGTWVEKQQNKRKKGQTDPDILHVFVGRFFISNSTIKGKICQNQTVMWNFKVEVVNADVVLMMHLIFFRKILTQSRMVFVYSSTWLFMILLEQILELLGSQLSHTT